MSDAFWLALIGLATMVVKEGLDWWKQRRLEKRQGMIAQKVEKVEANTNGLTAELAAAARAAGHAAGWREARGQG